MARREAFKMFLKPGFEDEYQRRHAAIWPELKKLLSDSGVKNYSIWWDKDTNILFAYQEVEGDEGSQDLGGNPVVQKWWDYMADIMEVNPDNSPVSIPLDERFYMEYPVIPAKPSVIPGLTGNLSPSRTPPGAAFIFVNPTDRFDISPHI